MKFASKEKMKYLEKINSPKDLKSIPKEELGEVVKNFELTSLILLIKLEDI